jgi:hypothetical protein
VKSDIRKPATYAGILAVLLLYRLVLWTLPSFKQPAGTRKMVTAESTE